jgi:hypothetical protein
MNKKESSYVIFVNSLVEIGDTILLFALPIWAGVAYSVSNDTDIVGGIFTTVILFVLFTVPFLPFTHLFKLFWHMVAFFLLLPVNIKRAISND